MKQQNKRSDSEAFDLQQLKANYQFTWHEPIIINQFQNEVREYVVVQNEYLKNKQLEDRAKQKKPKLSVKQRVEQTSFETEIERVLREITASVPEQIRPRFVKQLMPMFGVYDMTGMPKHGSRFMQITCFPMFNKQI